MNAQAYVDYLVGQHGLSPVAARAAIARFIQESSLRPTIVGDKSIPGGSVGFGQWNRERKQGLMNFAGDAWSDPYRQLDYFVHEGRGPEAAAFNKLIRARTPIDAINAMMDYERPRGWSSGNPSAGHGYQNTIRNYNTLGGPGATGAQYALNRDPVMMTSQVPDGPKGEESYRRFEVPDGPKGEESYARLYEAPDGPKGLESYGGGAAATDDRQQERKDWWDKHFNPGGGADTLAGLGGSMPSGARPPAVTPGAARVDAPDVGALNMQQAQMQRQMLAEAMARLNAGRLF